MGIICPLGCAFTFISLPKQSTESLRFMHVKAKQLHLFVTQKDASTVMQKTLKKDIHPLSIHSNLTIQGFLLT